MDGMRWTVGLLAALALLLSAPNAQASTDEQRLAAHGHSAAASFPGTCATVTVHLHADTALAAAYPDDPEVRGMGQNCEVWLRSGMSRTMFRFTLYHETYHATHCGCAADHSPAMDRAVRRALRRSSRRQRP